MRLVLQWHARVVVLHQTTQAGDDDGRRSRQAGSFRDVGAVLEREPLRVQRNVALGAVGVEADAERAQKAHAAVVAVGLGVLRQRGERVEGVPVVRPGLEGDARAEALLVRHEGHLGEKVLNGDGDRPAEVPVAGIAEQTDARVRALGDHADLRVVDAHRRGGLEGRG